MIRFDIEPMDFRAFIPKRFGNSPYFPVFHFIPRNLASANAPKLAPTILLRNLSDMEI